jgi:hypothetical protein
VAQDELNQHLTAYSERVENLFLSFLKKSSILSAAPVNDKHSLLRLGSLIGFTVLKEINVVIVIARLFRIWAKSSQYHVYTLYFSVAIS